MDIVKCRVCHKPMFFIETANGKQMPVDAKVLEFVPDTNGRDLYVTPEGDVLRGVPAKDEDPDVHVGYISHFATCTNPGYFRNRMRRGAKK